MYIKPAKGLQVMDPEKRDYLPAEGREVEPSQYWTRRLLAKEVTEAKPPKRTETKTEEVS